MKRTRSDEDIHNSYTASRSTLSFGWTSERVYLLVSLPNCSDLSARLCPYVLERTCLLAMSASLTGTRIAFPCYYKHCHLPYASCILRGGEGGIQRS